ncbi:MAG: hypothetical protein H6814_10745 [Phycisphaeraceae bacterium]|nr:hypothetical protein [Phycisphaeraceae bacterium]
MHHLVSTLAIAGAAVAATSADAVIIDFSQDAMGNPLVAGDIITNQFAPGVNISATGGSGLAVIFDTTNPTGNDSDLLTPNPGLHPSNTVSLGNALIVNEEAFTIGMDGRVEDPNDNVGGTFFFDLNFVATGLDITLLDIEEGGGFIQFFNSGSLRGGANITGIPAIGDGSVQTLHIDGVEFDSFRVTLTGSGAIPNLNIIPTPGAGALLAMGGIVTIRRRR